MASARWSKGQRLDGRSGLWPLECGVPLLSDDAWAWLKVEDTFSAFARLGSKLPSAASGKPSK
jgi:hypothetical protein